MVVVVLVGEGDWPHPQGINHSRWGIVTSYDRWFCGARRRLQRSVGAQGETLEMRREMPITINNVVVRSGSGKSQNKVIGGGRIKSNSLISMPLKDLFFTLLVWISRLVR